MEYLNYKKIIVIHVLYDIMYKYVLYFYKHVNQMEFFQNNVIAGVPTPGPYYIL